jgi:hypothetical protein
MFSHTRAGKGDESGSEHETAMNRMCEREGSGHDNVAEKSGAGEREGGDAIECKGEGCETLWVHESLETMLI